MNQLAKINQLGKYPLMGQGTPHCKLSVVKSLVQTGRVNATASAFNGACDLGIND